MVTIGIWSVIEPVMILLTAWAMARVAQAVGSPRGKLRFGFLALLFVVIVNIAFSAATVLSVRANPNGAIAESLFLLLVQAAIVLMVLRRTFGLSTGRAFAPFGALLAVGIVQLALVLLVIKPRLTETFLMPTASMSPTIESGDRFFVNKILRPRRWDLVAYRNVDQIQPQEPEIFCKRLIALPGERLRFDGGTIYINDQPANVPPVLAGRCHATLPRVFAISMPYTDGQTITLAADEYFFIGDNVDISGDSRIFGPSKSSSILGVIDVIYWPPGRIRVVR
ncbi:MAG: signal peptidase [Phycisphaerales bacterium]|nr:signal peptidase [Phycisphaerales bacterium]